MQMLLRLWSALERYDLSPNTPSPLDHLKTSHHGRSSETYSYFPPLRPEHAGLALEVLCPSASGNADAADVAECFGALMTYLR